MFRSILLLGLLVAFAQSYDTQQIQMPEASALLDSDESLLSQVQDLQRNVTELWTYIHTLRNAVTQHLNHLRQHQVELESTVHRQEHAKGPGGSHASHTDDQHSHSGEHHSHSGEHHSHSGEHHSHSGEHSSHGDDHQHSHSGEHSHSEGGHHHDSHSHTSDDSHSSHTDGGHHHTGGGGAHHHDSHSHTSEDSHSGGGGGAHHHDSHPHTSEDSHSEGGHHHRDSPESEDLQQSQQGVEPLPEPLVVSAQRPPTPSTHSRHQPTPGRPSPSTPKPAMQLMTEQGHHYHHRHHEPQPLSGNIRNFTRAAVMMPKYSEYALYDLAVCNVQPNRAIPEDKQQNIMGQITLWQKKLGGPLNIHMRLQGFSVGDHHGAHQALQTAQLSQQQDLEEDNEEPPVTGHRHGFHVHTFGDLSNGCQSTGPHYNPKAVNHGGPNALIRHVGDLGNIECDEHGITNLFFDDTVASLRGQYSIIGKSMVIHTGEDDYGLGGDEESLRTGNAGTRVACCVIQKADKIPIRMYKAMKSATQRHN